MIGRLFDRVAEKRVSHRRVQGVRRQLLATTGLACPETLEGRALLAGVVLPNLPAGSKYQIAFVSASVRQAGSTDIANYNAYVSGEASANKSLPATTWRAWVSTATVNARNNAPTYDDVPIYNTRGELIATNSAEFFSPTHRAGINYDQFGIRTDREVWTGSDYRGMGVYAQTAGSALVQRGRSWDIGKGGNWSSVDYAYAIVNPAGGTTPSGAISLYALSGVLTVGGATTSPSAPSGLVALPGNASVALSWKVPSSVGDSAISDYKVQFSSNGGKTWTDFNRTASNTTSATVTGLTNGVPYVFRVSAVNRAGAGAFTAPTAQAMPLLPSNPPSGVVLPNLPAGSKYQIAFVSASVRQAGSTDIANYNAYVSGEASANKSLPTTTWRAWVSTGSATGASWVNAKDNAPTYDDVPIYNTRGELIATNSAEFFSPTHRAGINYDQFGIRTDREVWTGSDYRGMGVYAQTAGSALVQRGRSWDIGKGGNWSSVDYAYAIVNPAGGTTPSGAISLYALSNILVMGGLAATPSPPTNLLCTPGNGQPTLTWSAPAFDGGSPITDYKVQFSSNEGKTWTDFNRTASNATSATVTGLTNGTPYVFRVAGVNSVGIGDFSTPSAPVAPITVPTAPRNLAGTPGDRQVRLTWSAPASDGGSSVFRYIVQLKTTTATEWTTPVIQPASYSPAYTATGLTNGVAYVFRVALVNAAGTGESATSAPVTPSTVPVAPSNLVATPGNGQASLTWMAPLSNGGSAITDYVVQYKTSTASTWITFPEATSPATSATVTGLTNGVSYLFRVAGVSQAGVGQFTATAVGATPVLKQDAVAGRWEWFNGDTYEFLSDGQVIRYMPDGTIKHRADASWRRPDANPSRYLFTWGNGQFRDDLLLSVDGKKLQGKNQYGTIVTGVRTATPNALSDFLPVGKQVTGSDARGIVPFKAVLVIQYRNGSEFSGVWTWVKEPTERNHVFAVRGSVANNLFLAQSVDGGIKVGGRFGQGSLTLIYDGPYLDTTVVFKVP